MKRMFALLLAIWMLPLVAVAELLRVGMSADYPPLSFRLEGRVAGVEVDNSRAAGEILGRRIEIVELPFTGLIAALLEGKIDVIMSGMSVSDERSEKVYFTDSYLRVGQMAILHRDKLGRFSQPWAVYREGVRIGVESGTTGAAFAETELKQAAVRQFGSLAAAFDALRHDEIDLFIHDAPTSWQLATSQANQDLLSLYAPLTDERIAWAVRPDDIELAGELNRALATMKANGTLQYILNRWIPVQVEVR